MRLLLLFSLAGCVDFDRLGTLYQPSDLGTADLSISDLAEFDFQALMRDEDLAAGDFNVGDF